MNTWRRHEQALLWVLFGVVGVLVVAPWMGHGWLLLLDWSAGPRSTLTTSAYGIDAVQADAMPVRLALVGLRHLTGPRISGWLVIWAVFPIGGAGMARLVGGPTVRRVAAGLLFVVNPFVLDRVRVGHVLFLLGYALLPWALGSFLAARHADRVFRVRSAAWLALLISISPHLAWIAGLLLAATLVWPRPRARDVVGAVLVAVAATTIYAYGLALHLAGVRSQTPGAADLAAFATRGGSAPAVTANVALLSGFWRGGRDPHEVVGPIWFALVLVVLALVLLGLREAYRRPEHRALVVAVGVAGLGGLVLAGGTAGLVGGGYRVLFDHLPLFAVMREPQKWAALVALAYATGFGFGCEALVARSAQARAGSWAVPAARLAAVSLPFLVAPNLVWGLGGEVRTSRYPESWASAQRSMGDGPEAVLFLPWHQYQPFTFTGERTVATPAAAYFGRPVVAADDAELPGGAGASTSARSAYVSSLVARAGRIHHLGRLLAPLGVGYVVAPGRGPDARWLAQQADLRLVRRTADLVLYRSLVTGTGRVAGAVAVRDVDQAIALSETGELGDAALLVDGSAAPTPRPTDLARTGSGGLDRRNVVTYDQRRGPAGWTVVPQAANAGWRLDGQPGRPTVSGVLAFRVGADDAVVGYRPWRFVLAGYVVSTLALLALLIVGLVEHRAEWLGRRTHEPVEAAP